MGIKLYSKGKQLWSAQADRLSISKVIEMYGSGFAGAFQEPEQREKFVAALPVASGMAVASQFGLTETGKGKLSLPYIFAHKHYPKCWPSPAQETGSCVSKAAKNCSIVLIGVESELATPDPVTGKVEGWPVVSAKAEENGVVASEPSYGYRGHSGQGASCGRLQNYMVSKGGVILRKNYTEIGIDLEEADDMLGAGWGWNGTPEKLNAIGREHQIRTATECENHEVCRDFVANGYPIWVCSDYGFSSSRDANGYSRRSGSWSHSWIVAGYDDRDQTKQMYGGPLFLFLHDWGGSWNSGGRRILGTNIDIPLGCFWSDARLLDNCETTAMSSLNGWPRQKLPDWGFGGFG